MSRPSRDVSLNQGSIKSIEKMSGDLFGRPPLAPGPLALSAAAAADAPVFLPWRYVAGRRGLHDGVYQYIVIDSVPKS